MTPEQMRAAAREMVADWPAPTAEQMTDVAALMGPFLGTTVTACVSHLPRQRTVVRRAA